MLLCMHACSCACSLLCHSCSLFVRPMLDLVRGMVGLLPSRCSHSETHSPRTFGRRTTLFEAAKQKADSWRDYLENGQQPPSSPVHTDSPGSTATPALSVAPSDPVHPSSSAQPAQPAQSAQSAQHTSRPRVSTQERKHDADALPSTSSILASEPVRVTKRQIQSWSPEKKGGASLDQIEVLRWTLWLLMQASIFSSNVIHLCLLFPSLTTACQYLSDSKSRPAERGDITLNIFTRTVSVDNIDQFRNLAPIGDALPILKALGTVSAAAVASSPADTFWRVCVVSVVVHSISPVRVWLEYLHLLACNLSDDFEYWAAGESGDRSQKNLTITTGLQSTKSCRSLKTCAKRHLTCGHIER